MVTRAQVDEWDRQICDEIYDKVVRPFILDMASKLKPIPAKNARHLVSRNKREGWYEGRRAAKHGGTGAKHCRTGAHRSRGWSLRHWHKEPMYFGCFDGNRPNGTWIDESCIACR